MGREEILFPYGDRPKETEGEVKPWVGIGLGMLATALLGCTLIVFFMYLL